uniref:Tc1-like transposase DDE domain-containing protein n=1 Tax=Homalodisca liturata TaxID=320908 RepID=A0A1B6JU20_9HEMI
MLQNWLFLQLTVDSENFNYQQDRAPPYWHNNMRRFLNDNLPRCWIGRTGPQDPALHSWPPRSTKTPCDIFLWGYVKERVNVPPLPCDIDELKNRISAAVASVTEDTLRKVCSAAIR